MNAAAQRKIATADLLTKASVHSEYSSKAQAKKKQKDLTEHCIKSKGSESNNSSLLASNRTIYLS